MDKVAVALDEFKVAQLIHKEKHDAACRAERNYRVARSSDTPADHLAHLKKLKQAADRAEKAAGKKAYAKRDAYHALNLAS